LLKRHNAFENDRNSFYLFFFLSGFFSAHFKLYKIIPTCLNVKKKEEHMVLARIRIDNAFVAQIT